MTWLLRGVAVVFGALALYGLSFAVFVGQAHGGGLEIAVISGAIVAVALWGRSALEAAQRGFVKGRITIGAGSEEAEGGEETLVMRLFDRIYGRRCDCEHLSNVADSPTDAADMLHDFVQCVGVCGAAVIVNAALEACQCSRVGFHGRTHIPRRGTERVEMFMADVRHCSDNTPCSVPLICAVLDDSASAQTSQGPM
jgi:hypothetical protein